MLRSIRSTIAGWISPEGRSMDGIGSGMLQHGFATPTLAGPAINGRTALSIPAVFNAVNIYASTIGALDFYVAQEDSRGAKSPAYDHPCYDLIHSRPNCVSTSMRLRQALVGHVLTEGNGYLEIEWDARGRYAKNLHLMDPRGVEPILKEDGRVVYRLEDHQEIESCDVIHIAMFGWDGLRGYSPITVGRDTLGISAAQRTFQASLFGNGLGMTGHLELPGTLNTKQKSQLRDDFNRVHQGPSNAGNLGILDGGMKWVQTSFSPQDAELILGCHFSVEEIARLFNLPQHMLGLLDHATFSNIEEQNIAFYQQSLLPFLVAIEQEFNNKIFGPTERTRFSVRHDVSTLLRGNTVAQREQEKADLSMGVRSINEIRIARGLNPIANPNADKHWVPTNNLTALEDLGKTPPEPADLLDPDSTTEEEPNPVTPDDGPPKPLPPGSVDTLRDLLADPMGRMVRQELEAIRRAAKHDRFDLWAAGFYPKHADKMARSIGPALRALGGKSTPEELSRNWVVASQAQLRDLYTTTPPDEMPGAVERIADQWTGERASKFLDDIAGPKS